MIEGLHMRGHKNIRHHGFSLYMQEVHDNKLFEVKADSLEMVERELWTEDSGDTTFNFSDEAMQLLLDDLWEAGFRPSDGTGNVGQLKATQNHLADMKKIVFHSLKIK